MHLKVDSGPFSVVFILMFVRASGEAVLGTQRCFPKYFLIKVSSKSRTSSLCMRRFVKRRNPCLESKTRLRAKPNPTPPPTNLCRTRKVHESEKRVEEVEGGYVVSNGRGQGISFAIHHAPPQVAKLSLKVSGDAADGLF